jgi:FAD-linked sulfhydryl oxidase
MGRRQHLTFTIALGLLIFISVSYLLSGHGEPHRRSPYPSSDDRLPADPPVVPVKPAPEGSSSEFKVDLDAIPVGILEGESIAPKLENATLKYGYAPYIPLYRQDH